jgi:type IV pilus assembly protein PilQ
VKELRAISLATAATVALFGGHAASANPTQVTNVRINPNGAGFDVVLETQGGKAPQVFNVNQGNTWNAYVFNAQIAQPFRQANPAPGISQISVIPSGSNGVQVSVVGTQAAPIGQIASRTAQGVILNVSGAGGGSAPATPANAPTASLPLNVPPAPMNSAQSMPSTPMPSTPIAQAMPNSSTPIAPFVPSAQVPSQGQPAVPVAPTPPLLRRAVAPPVGDQAVSQIDASATTIDLGTNERIPRLVLRDAPVREVLSLLARAANLNLAYSENGANSATPAATGPGARPAGPTISLDIQNESVQDVFNYVLRVACIPVSSGAGGASGGTGACAALDVNRVGRTIFVGPRLPDDARNFITRTIRLNQVSVADAAGFLTTQGAETQRPFEQVEIQTVGEGAAARTIERRTPSILALRAVEGTAPLILRGLSVSSNDRLNSITITGLPRKVEIATRLLGQLDARKRQVAINVKIVDVNLLKTDDFNTSFSFGVGNNFFSVDQGAATFNFGAVRPPTSAEIRGSLTGRPITNGLFPQGSQLEPFLDSPNGAPLSGGTTNTPIFGNVPVARPPFGTNSNPLQPGVTEITPPSGTDPGSIEFSLPTLFQFPSRFLARLQAQVTSGNAKILTDPTVVVQEGEKASVRLTQDVITNTKITRTDTAGVSRETVELERQDAGLTLDINLERIDDNGFVSVRINPSVTAPVNSVDTGAGRVVLLSRRDITSGLIRLRDGQTLILSGIIQESDRTSVRKVPILGDLPLLGSLFRSTNRENQRQEVVVMLTPQILDDSDQSSFGFGYVPGRETRQFLQQQENR